MNIYLFLAHFQFSFVLTTLERSVWFIAKDSSERSSCEKRTHECFELKPRIFLQKEKKNLLSHRIKCFCQDYSRPRSSHLSFSILSKAVWHQALVLLLPVRFFHHNSLTWEEAAVALVGLLNKSHWNWTKPVSRSIIVPWEPLPQIVSIPNSTLQLIVSSGFARPHSVSWTHKLQQIRSEVYHCKSDCKFCMN